MYPYDDNNNENKIPDPTPNTWYSKTGEDAGVPAQEPREGSESHGVPPEAARTTWKDADYTPQSDSTAPPRYFVPEDKPIKEKKPREKGNHSFAGVAALCLTCAILGGVAGGAVYGGIVKDSGTGNTPVITTSTVTPSPTSASQLASGTALSGADIYAMACEQVVGIQTEITTNYFGMTTSGSVSGSGFVITADGYILTNYHVVSSAYTGGYQPQVMLHDGTSYPATIVGFDSDNDVAVLKIDAEGLTPVTIGNSDSLRVGDTVYAVGNPLGELAYSMSTGSVSGTDRVITTDESTSINMFQIDAAVNSGNSGGPVYNTLGQVIGIVTAKYGSSSSGFGSSSSSSVEGLGFAIPINDAVDIANDIMTNGYVTGKAFMGIQSQTIDASAAQYYNMPQGAYIASVTAGSAAEQAGLKLGDIITGLDGVEVTSKDDLSAAVKTHKAGETVDMSVWRSGETLTLTITFDEKQPSSTETTTPQTDGQQQQQQENPFGFNYGW
jgi:serine protease Do